MVIRDASGGNSDGGGADGQQLLVCRDREILGVPQLFGH